MDMKDTLLAVSGLLGGSGSGGSGGPLITQQPADVTDEIGVTVHFSVTASGTGLTYMWQSNMYEEWRDTSFSTSTTATLALKVSQERDGVQYRCKITDGDGHVVYSNPATLRVTVPEPVFITKTFTANGTYAASDDNADGYSEVTVNVSGGGGDGTLLADYTATEDVKRIDISGVFSGYRFFKIKIVGNTNANEWIYDAVNDTNTGKYFFYGQSSKVWDIENYVVVRPTGHFNGDVGRYEIFHTAPDYTISVDNYSAMTKWSFYLYNASSVFKAGFNVKVWGYYSL